MMSGSAGAGMGIRDGEGQSDRAQQRHIRGIITDVGALGGAHAELRGQGAKVPQLVAAPLYHMADAQFPAASRYATGVPPGENGDPDPGLRQSLQSMTVLDVEALQGLALCTVVQAPVG
jgi:hypothetical protein